MVERILVPLDGSELAAQALPHARYLADELHARLLLLWVVETVSYSGDPGEAMPALFEVHEMAQTYLERVAAQLRNNGRPVESHVLSGTPAESILACADDRAVDLIVMSTHGRSGIGRWVYGSVADKVLRGARVPVLLIRAVVQEAPLEAVRYERLLVPLDGSALAEQALPHAEELARATGAEIVLLRVPTVPPFVTWGPDPGMLMPALLNEAYEEADAYLANVARRLRACGFVVRKAPMDPGPVADTIIDYAHEADIDLIVMSTHGRSGIGRWVFGSVTDRVLRGAGVPVLLVRASDG